MKISVSILRRPGLVISALALAVAGVAPVFESSAAHAGQVTARFIQLSNATPSATGVTYNVSFKPSVLTAIGGIVVDFCADSPIIGSTTCTYPAGFNVGGATPTVSGLSGTSNNTGWTAAGQQGGGPSGAVTQTLAYTRAGGAVAPLATTTAINFQITSVTNPSTTGSFFARILTFDTAANTASQYTIPEGATTTRAASYANSVDYGGVALSTDNAISITAAVQETLTFCVSKVAPTASCGGTSTPALTLGHGTPKALDNTATDVDTAYTQLSTNANAGVIVNMKNTSSTTCAGLSRDAGATCGIAAQTTAGAITAGVAALFGVQVAAGTPLGGGSGSTAATGSYGTAYYMANATFGTYGDPIMNSGGTVCSNVNTLLTFAATATPTTPAGLYTATESLIATGTF